MAFTATVNGLSFADECADAVRGVPDLVVRQLAELQQESHMQASSVYAMLGSAEESSAVTRA